MLYLAHIKENGDAQTVLEHLSGTAALCREFASVFGAAEHAERTGIAHDLGKYSRKFQERLHGGAKVDHSTAGAFVCCSELNDPVSALCIAGHHGGIPDLGTQGDTSESATLFGRMKKAQEGNIPDFSAWKEELILPSEIRLPEFIGKDPFTDSFYIRMLYSCLVDADYLDTERFMKDGIAERGNYESLSELLKKLEDYISGFWPPQTGLNEKRCQILQSCLNQAERKPGLYTLTVPTGGGKTIASLAFALRHAVKNGLRRVIYVIPYTSIIEQNAEVFRNIVGSENVIEHHSGIAYDPESDLDKEGYRKVLAAENWDAPVIVTTAVQFFESLYANKPSKCRKLHNLSNSVIIFDEAQMIPGDHLKPCVAVISQLVKYYGASAVLCTATQPVLQDLFYEDNLEPIELCADAKVLFEQLRRVSYRNIGEISVNDLIEELQSKQQVLCIVNSRNAAQLLYEQLPKENAYHLSTLMFPLHRRQVLDEIRMRLKEGQICRVISTSLIEAGVDVDFPLVYREIAGLDSIIQAAGRCNREGKRSVEESLITIFESEWNIPDLFRKNIGAAREALSGDADPGDPNTMLRYFRSWRDLVGDSIDLYKVVDCSEISSSYAVWYSLFFVCRCFSSPDGCLCKEGSVSFFLYADRSISG